MCRPGCSHCASQVGLARRRGADHDVALAHDRFGRGRHDDVDAELGLHVVDVARELLGDDAVDVQALEVAHHLEAAHLVARLRARADHAGGLDLAPRQHVGGERPGQAGAQLGEVAVVDEQRLQKAGLRADQDHHARAVGQTLGGVVGKARCDLDGEAVEALDVGRLDVDLAVVLGDLDGDDGGREGASFGEAREALGDRFECLAVEPGAAADLGLGKQRHLHLGPLSGECGLEIDSIRPHDLPQPCRPWSGRAPWSAGFARGAGARRAARRARRRARRRRPAA